LICIMPERLQTFTAEARERANWLSWLCTVCECEHRAALLATGLPSSEWVQGRSYFTHAMTCMHARGFL
jgi:hypothetical protein